MTDLITHYFPHFSPSIIAKLEALQPLYAYWNERINLISRKDFEHFSTRHLLYSLAIAKYVSFSKRHRILDVGTGGGFPGIPLAVVFPETQFVLLDSIAKKLKVVDAVAQELQLKNVTTLHMRAEQHKTTYDYVTGRAVKNLPQFYAWTKKNLKPKGSILYLGGGNHDFSFAKTVKQIPLYPDFADSYFETKQLFIFR